MLVGVSVGVGEELDIMAIEVGVEVANCPHDCECLKLCDRFSCEERDQLAYSTGCNFPSFAHCDRTAQVPEHWHLSQGQSPCQNQGTLE